MFATGCFIGEGSGLVPPWHCCPTKAEVGCCGSDPPSSRIPFAGRKNEAGVNGSKWVKGIRERGGCVCTVKNHSKRETGKAEDGTGTRTPVFPCFSTLSLATSVFSLRRRRGPCSDPKEK